MIYGSLPLLVLLVLVFWSGAIAKVLHFRDFRATVMAYDVLPAALTVAFADAFVLAEVLAGGLMLTPSVRVSGILCAIALLIVASTGILVNLVRGRVGVSCGCGALSDGGEGLSWWMIVRNVVLVVVALVALRAGAGDPFAAPVVNVSGAVAVGLILTLVYFGANQAIAVHVRLHAPRGVMR